MEVYNPTGYSYVTVVKIPKTEVAKIDMSLCAQPRQTLKRFYDSCETKPAILCNGGFFNMSDGSTILNYADEGVVISTSASCKEGMGITSSGSLKFGTAGVTSFVDFVSAYPVLIKAGKATTINCASEIDYAARRTILAYNNDYVFIIAVESPGMNFKAMQDFLLLLDVTYAINLDGGGSTKILKNGASITSSVYNRAVDNVVAVYLNPKTLYRVQVGAFSKKKNAESLLTKIQGLTDTISAGYAKAYIRKVGRYYKVQVGAFSIKANATKVVNDLKSKGYNAFVAQ